METSNLPTPTSACLALALAIAAALPAAAPAPAGEAAPLRLAPDQTVILFAPGSEKPAKLLQQALRLGYGLDKSGFETVADGQAGALQGKAVLAVGGTRAAAAEDRAGLAASGVRIRRRGQTVLLLGGGADAETWAVTHFLDRCCGIRFYMPGDLFTSRPEKTPVELGAVDWESAPSVRAGACHTWGAPGGGEFMHAHALFRRPISHQHTMCENFPPERFKDKYPEIYPLRDGKRYFPAKGDQGWQPCFSEPKLVDAAVEYAEKLFAEKPDCPYVAFSIQDSRDFCRQDRESKDGISNVYWRFMNSVAERLEKKFPDKQVLGIAYNEVSEPPGFKLHRNVSACLVFKIADIAIDGRFDGGQWDLKRWAKVASNLGNHDWAYGKGYLIPRIYTGFIKKTFTEFERLGAPLRFAYSEAGPNWGLDGPKLYLMARIWWDPAVDTDLELGRFCRDLFGPAAAPMEKYFRLWEELYCRNLNMRTEQKMNLWDRQFMKWTPEELAQLDRLRALMDEAVKGAAGIKLVEERVGLFARSFRLTEMLVRIGNAKTVTRAELDAVREHVKTQIAPDQMTICHDKPAEAIALIEGVLKRISPPVAK